MNLEFEKGQTVKMVSHDNMVVEGAIGVIESTTDVQTRTVKVLWGGMSAFKADYRYRCGFKEIGTTEVDIETALISGNGFSRKVTFYERN